MNSLLVQSANDRIQLRGAISALSTCSNVAAEASMVEATASARQVLLQKLGQYDLKQLPGYARLQNTLESALSDSVQADRDFAGGQKT